MLDLALENGEDPSRGAMIGPSGGNRRDRDRDTVAIKGGAPRGDADDEQQRPARRDLRRPKIFARLECLSGAQNRCAAWGRLGDRYHGQQRTADQYCHPG